MNNCAKRKIFFWGVLGIFSEELGIFSKQYLPKNPRKRPAKIDPRNDNKKVSDTTTHCLMADSGSMCSLLNFKTVRAMGINPEKLETSNVTITGVNGKQLQSQTRQMHVRIVNTSNQQESWEKVYVSEEIKISLVSKDCLIRLKILDPTLFLSDKEVRSFSVHTVEEKDSKLTECEKSSFKNKDGSIG